jgi:hypothetical protein
MRSNAWQEYPMRDWKPFVREQMDAMNLAPDQKEEIVSEIAAHFEDIVEAARSEGLTEAEALERATTEKVDWRRLAAQIQRTKRPEETMSDRTKRLLVGGLAALTAASVMLIVLRAVGGQRHTIWLWPSLAFTLYIPWLIALPFFGMNERTKKFWMPGFISLASASIFLIILGQIHYAPHVILTRSALAITVYPVWLAGQPLFGALGAYFSRRGGGTLWARVGSALLPSLVLTTAIFVVLLIRAFTSDPHELGPTNASMLTNIAGAVVIPSVGLLVGALPFLRESKTEALARN